MRPIDADSLTNLIKIRMAWHSGYTVEEILTDIAQSPTINEFGEPDKPTGEWIAVEKTTFRKSLQALQMLTLWKSSAIQSTIL